MKLAVPCEQTGGKAGAVTTCCIGVANGRRISMCCMINNKNVDFIAGTAVSSITVHVNDGLVV